MVLPSELAQVEALLEAGRTAEALQRVRQLLKENPGQLQARLLLARVHAATNPQLAITLLEELLAEQPGLLPAALLLSTLLAQEGRIPAARATLEALASPADPRIAQALAALQPSTELYQLRGEDMFDHPLLADRLDALGRPEAALGIWIRLKLAAGDSAPPTLLAKITELEERLSLGEPVVEQLENTFVSTPESRAHQRARLSRWLQRH